MIREKTIQALDGLVGFRQPLESGYNVLDQYNLRSDSGLYFEDGSGIVTVKNIIDSYENDNLTDEQINDVLDNIRLSAVRDILNTIFADKSQIVESNTLFPYEEEFKTTYDLTDDFYYIEIRPTLNKRLALHLESIWLSFNEAATFNIYLFHSKKLAPVQTKEVTTVAHEATQVELNWYLEDTGTYRIGYKRSELGTAKPYERDFELANVAYRSDYAYMDFYSSNFLANGRIDVDNDNALEDGYGMNLNFSVFTDWSHEIEKNKHRFARAVQVQMSITAIDRILTSTRTNVTERLTEEAVLRLDYILGNEARGTGLKGQFKKEIEAIKKFFFPKNLIQTYTLR